MASALTRDARLGLGEPAEDRERGRLSASGSDEPSMMRHDVGKSAMRLLRLGEVYVRERRADPRRRTRSARSDQPGDPHFASSPRQRVGVDAGVEISAPSSMSPLMPEKQSR